MTTEEKNIKENNDVIVLLWDFSPPDYFEEAINIKRNNYVMTIDNGKVDARIDHNIYNKQQKMKDDLHKTLNTRLAISSTSISCPARFL